MKRRSAIERPTVSVVEGIPDNLTLMRAFRWMTAR